MKRILIGVALLGGIMFAPALAGATTEHCPDGGVKVEANGGTQDAINALVLDAGVRVCVKGSTDATGIVIADGETNLEDILDNGHDVSYYVIYPPIDEPELLQAFVCFEGEISVLTDEDQAALNLKVALFLELNVGAIQVLSAEDECEAPVATTTTTTAPPVVTTTTTAPPVTDTAPPSPPRTAEPVSVELLPTQPVAAPTNQLPHTGLGDWLWITGAALLLSGIMMSLVGRRIPA